MRTSKLSLLLLGAAAAGTAGVPAMAGGLAPVVEEPAPAVVAPAPVMPAVADWSGLYGGLSYSKSMGNYDNGGSVDFDDGTAPGAFLGYNFQNGAFVYGGELAYHKFNDTTLKGTPSTEANDTVDLKARLGYAAGNALIYGTAGYSMASIDTAGGSQDFNGVNYGLGVDYLISDHFVVGAEYLKRNLSGQDSASGIDSDLSTLGVRVGYKF